MPQKVRPVRQLLYFVAFRRVGMRSGRAQFPVAKPVYPCSARVQLHCWKGRYTAARAQIYADLGKFPAESGPIIKIKNEHDS